MAITRKDFLQYAALSSIGIALPSFGMGQINQDKPAQLKPEIVSEFEVYHTEILRALKKCYRITISYFTFHTIGVVVILNPVLKRLAMWAIKKSQHTCYQKTHDTIFTLGVCWAT